MHKEEEEEDEEYEEAEEEEDLSVPPKMPDLVDEAVKLTASRCLLLFTFITTRLFLPS